MQEKRENREGIIEGPNGLTQRGSVIGNDKHPVSNAKKKVVWDSINIQKKHEYWFIVCLTS